MRSFILWFLAVTGAHYRLVSLVRWRPMSNLLFRIGWEKKDVDYASKVYHRFVERLQNNNVALEGKRVLEIGSGHHLDLARVFLEQQMVGYYVSSDPFLQKDGGETPLVSKKLDITNQSLHEEERFDIILSNAVFEHLPKESMDTVFRNLAKLTVQGGISAHQIDFRDHVAKAQPFDNMKFDPQEWDRRTVGTIFYVNRLRLDDYLEVAKRHGFTPLFVERKQYNGAIAFGWEASFSEKIYDADVFLLLRRD